MSRLQTVQTYVPMKRGGRCEMVVAYDEDRYGVEIEGVYWPKDKKLSHDMRDAVDMRSLRERFE